jgi:cell shape-determining protein MreC
VITSRQLIGCSVALLALSGVFGLLNLQKTRGLRTKLIESESDRHIAERLRLSREKELQGVEAAFAEADSKFANSQGQLASTKAELQTALTEKSDLSAKLEANETEITELRQRVEDAESRPDAKSSPATVSVSSVDLQAQLAEAKKQLEAAENEKILLAEKMKVLAESATAPVLESVKPRRPVSAREPGIRGSVLAVNQAYNFVVLSLGGRQGVEINSEMLVLRGGSLIGKIRISSVEPATAIGDIITSSLARGVQVQPGDTVIYGGSNH